MQNTRLFILMDKIIVHIHGICVTFRYMYTISNDQIRAISISVTPNIYHFFVLGTFKILSGSFFKIYNKFF
jgi:hypothetical protein